MRIWKAKDTSIGVCYHCKDQVTTRFEYQTVRLEKTGVNVPSVLVGVCQLCGSVVTIPQQSAPKLQAARERLLRPVESRIPLELEDAIGMIALEFDARPEPFKGALARYYLDRICREPRLAERVAEAATSPLASGSPGGRLTFRCEATLREEALGKAMATGIKDWASLMRGVLVVAVDDALQGKASKRVHSDLHALALGAVAG